MSDHVVLKAINSTARRFKVGDVVSESDDWSPHDFNDLKARGFVGAAGSVPTEVHSEAATHSDTE